MAVRVGVVMDPIEALNIKKDSTFAMMLAAQARAWRVHYLQMEDLYVRDGRACGRARPVTVTDDPAGWYALGEPEEGPLDAMFDMILMRKDPPFDTEYFYATHLLERAQAFGCLVANRPQGLRNASEKLYTASFPELCPPTLVARRAEPLRGFLDEHGDIVVKPLGGMGGASVFRVRRGDPNLSVIIETLTDHGRRFAMAQRFLPAIDQGDKRILMIDGEPVPYALARIPAPGELRGNLAAGASGKGVALSDRDREICRRVGPALRQQGLWFAGLDVIGDCLTEINVTSPTCIRELDAAYELDIAGQLLERLEQKLS